MNNIVKDVYAESGEELRVHGSKGFPIAHYTGDVCSVPVQLHWHDELEAGYVLEGQVTLFAGKDKVLLHPGDGFLINARIPHGFNTEEDITVGRQCSVVFDPILIGGRFDSIFWRHYVQPVLAAATLSCVIFESGAVWHAEAVNSLQNAWEALNRRDSEYELEVRHELSHLLFLVCKHLPAQQPAGARHALRDNERIRTMLSFIQAHFDENLSAADIAASAMISPSECLRCFHNTIGQTPVQYIKYYRVQRAAHLLLSTDLKIAEVAESCGFQEMSYFAKTFRAYMRCSPYEYRKRSRESSVSA